MPHQSLNDGRKTSYRLEPTWHVIEISCMCARVPHKQTSKANGFQTKPVLAYEWEARDDGESVPEHSKTSPCCFSMDSANSLIMSPCSASEHCGLSVCEAYCTQRLEPHALCHHHHPDGVPSPSQTMEVTTLQCTHLAHKFKLHTWYIYCTLTGR